MSSCERESKRMQARRGRAGARTTLFSHSRQRQPYYESGANNHQPHPNMITERGDSPNEEQQGASNAFELRPPICTETEFVDSPEVQQISEGNRCRRGSERHAAGRAGNP